MGQNINISLEHLTAILEKLDELEQRVNIVGQNGNTGEHYDVARSDIPTNQPLDYAKDD